MNADQSVRCKRCGNKFLVPMSKSSKALKDQKEWFVSFLEELRDYGLEVDDQEFERLATYIRQGENKK